MKKAFNKTILGFAIAIAATLQAQAGTPATYILTVTNGSAMPISPMAIYTENGQIGKTQVGQAPSAGFIQLCQTGNPMIRLQELGANTDVTFKTQTMGLLFPGETTSIEVEVRDPLTQSIHFEAMYGKTKDACAIATIGSHSLYALKQHVTTDIVSKDNAVQTGAFLDSALPTGQTYLDSTACDHAVDAVSCLRALSVANTGVNKVRFFSPYLSSVTMLLEAKYGAAETQTLIIPTSGAVEFKLKLKH